MTKCWEEQDRIAELFGQFSFLLEYLYALSQAFHVAQWWRICLQMLETWVQSRVQKIFWRMKWQTTPVFLPEESHGQRSLAAGCSPWSQKKVRYGLATKQQCTLSAEQANTHKNKKGRRDWIWAQLSLCCSLARGLSVRAHLWASLWGFHYLPPLPDLGTLHPPSAEIQLFRRVLRSFHVLRSFLGKHM